MPRKKPAWHIENHAARIGCERTGATAVVREIRALATPERVADALIGHVLARISRDHRFNVRVLIEQLARDYYSGGSLKKWQPRPAIKQRISSIVGSRALVERVKDALRPMKGRQLDRLARQKAARSLVEIGLPGASAERLPTLLRDQDLAERVNDFETPREGNLVLRQVEGRGDRMGPGAVSAANRVDPQVVHGRLR